MSLFFLNRKFKYEIIVHVHVVVYCIYGIYLPDGLSSVYVPVEKGVDEPVLFLGLYEPPALPAQHGEHAADVHQVLPLQQSREGVYIYYI